MSANSGSNVGKLKLKELVRLEKAIEALLSEGARSKYLQRLIEKFGQIVDGFDKDDGDEEKGYTDKAVQFMVRFGKLPKSPVNSQSHFPTNVKQHDGQVMSFAGFWKHFETEVMSQPFDEATKLGLLLKAVDGSDTTAIAACSTIKEASEYLLRKYDSVNVSTQKSGPSISQSKQLNVSASNAIKDALFHGDKFKKPTEAQMNAEKLFKLCMVGDSDMASAKEKVLVGARHDLVWQTYCALVYKCAEHFMLKGKNDDISGKLVNIVSFCTRNPMELSKSGLLSIIADVYRDLQFPQYGLTELLGVLCDNDVTSPKIIANCYLNGEQFRNMYKLALEKSFNVKLPFNL